MARQYSQVGEGKTFVTDDDYPGVHGIGRSRATADKDFSRKVAVGWHERRISNIQASIDKLFAGENVEREEVKELQAMLDDCVSLLRKNWEQEEGEDG